ncbi:hypothetical protein B0F90DRAFT_1703836 [Multifurca ochricompacta]|uniref:Uncharacterized protein n=1 Tax=Multifurca ochricompacta TaxID=376703 RepID=A0AAD4MA88_9AGAM|nr:hypothetical protein B0F90DRAFT_1703836 [Multifurca ochricompacta]
MRRIGSLASMIFSILFIILVSYNYIQAKDGGRTRSARPYYSGQWTAFPTTGKSDSEDDDQYCNGDGQSFHFSISSYYLFSSSVPSVAFRVPSAHQNFRRAIAFNASCEHKYRLFAYQLN